MMREYREALKFYGAASMLDLTDPRPPMHSAECHLALGEYSRAHACIDYALAQARAHQQERHRALVPRLEAMLTFLEKGQTESSHG
jgi:hypothetical protein